MLKKVMFTALAIVVTASMAMAVQTVDPSFVPTNNGPAAANHDRIGLVNDGSFEFGTCTTGSAWACYADNTCDWIYDFSALGLPLLSNYDGSYGYWLGGFCGGAMSSDGACQTITIDGPTLSWWWAGYVTTAGDLVDFTMDGSVIYTKVIALTDHTAEGTNGPVWNNDTCDISGFMGGDHELCINYYATVGANLFTDFFEILPGTATEDGNFSMVKSLY